MARSTVSTGLPGAAGAGGGGGAAGPGGKGGRARNGYAALSASGEQGDAGDAGEEKTAGAKGSASGAESDGPLLHGPALDISTRKLAEAKEAKAYSAHLALSGKAAGVVWSAFGLPPGLSLGPVSGVITGAPNAAGTFDVVVLATANDGSAVAGATVLLNVAT